MYLSKGLFQQPLLDDLRLLLVKLSQLLDTFLSFPQVTRLIVDALELLHFKDLVLW